MITLHHLRIGRSIYTVWLLEEVGVEYELKIYHRNPTTMRACDDLKEAHPLGKSPVIVDDGLTISESGAITSYILEKFDSKNVFCPPRGATSEWAKYNQWLHYPEGSAFTPLLMKMLLMKSGQDHELISAFSSKEIQLHLGYISDQLGEKRFILSDKISGADFGITYIISMAEKLDQLDDYPNLSHYLKENTRRSAFKRALEQAVE